MCAVVYIGDILIFSSDKESYNKYSERFLEQLRDKQMFASVRSLYLSKENTKVLVTRNGKIGIRVDS